MCVCVCVCDCMGEEDTPHMLIILSQSGTRCLSMCSHTQSHPHCNLFVCAGEDDLDDGAGGDATQHTSQHPHGPPGSATRRRSSAQHAQHAQRGQLSEEDSMPEHAAVAALGEALRLDPLCDTALQGVQCLVGALHGVQMRMWVEQLP